MKRTGLPSRSGRRRLWAAIPVALGMALLLAVPAAASTVQIDDQANVLNVTNVQNEAATLPVPIYIWTTTQDAANQSAFDNDVREKRSAEFPIVLGINTGSHHETLQMGPQTGFSQDAANAAASSANSAFDGVMRSRNDYTGAVLAAVTSLRSSLDARGNGGESGSSRSHGPGLVVGIIVLVVLVVVIALLGRLFRGYRRTRTMAGPPMGYGGYGPPPGYGQGYGGGYGPGYGGGYGGGGMGPGAAAGLGAVGGGLLGYELGKMEGENDQFRRDEMFDNNQNYGDQGGGGGDWTVGQDSDFGGGDSGGGDSGGDSGGGGGDW